MSYIPASGSVVVFQGNPSVHQAVVAVTNFPTNPSISGTVAVSNFPTNQNVSGSIVAFISGTVPVNAAGSVVAFQGTSPWVINGSVSGAVSISNFPTTQNVSGSVVVSGTVAVTGLQGASVSGTVAVSNFPTTQNVSGSVISFNASTNPGSVVAFQGTNPWVIQSIVGTYAEDAAHTSADKGIFILGVRNDTVASFVSANTEYNAFAHDSAGRVLNKPFAAEEARIEGYNSVVSTSVTTLVAAAGAGLKNYVTDVVLANTGATTALVTFRSGGGTSVLGYGIAPTGGGSNMIGWNVPMRTLANETFDFQTSASSSVIYVKVSGYKAP